MTTSAIGHHDTVLLKEAVDALDIQSGDTVVDATLGGAGHFALLLSKLGPEGTLIGIDADNAAIARAQAVIDALDTTTLPTIHLVEDNFRNLEAILAEKGIQHADKILFDLGWSGFHLSAGRGFSFKTDEPLLMTYGDPKKGSTAADMVNLISEQALADLIYSLGEERFARSVARSIVETREQDPIITTFELVKAIEAGTPSWYHHRRIHPATKTFQALRIGVNDELGALRDGLAASFKALPKGGRVAVITFHSIEDRIVKHVFRDAAYEGSGTLVTRKPIMPSAHECVVNPRARSAKLRVFEAGVSDVLSITHTTVSTYA